MFGFIYFRLRSLQYVPLRRRLFKASLPLNTPSILEMNITVRYSKTFYIYIYENIYKGCIMCLPVSFLIVSGCNFIGEFVSFLVSPKVTALVISTAIEACIKQNISNILCFYSFGAL